MRIIIMFIVTNTKNIFINSYQHPCEKTQWQQKM